MSKYFLDTNILSYLDDKDSQHHLSVTKNISSLVDDDSLCVSILSLYELQYSDPNIDNDFKENIMRSINRIEEIFDIVPLSSKGAKLFGELKTDYQQKEGINKIANKKNDIDFMIASSAICEGATLVSNDKIFQKIYAQRDDFKFANWTQ